MVYALGVVPFGVTALGDHVHDVGLAADGAAGQGSGHDLGHRCQIGCDSVADLGSTWGGSEPGDHLIENQHHAVLVAQLSQSGQVLRHVKRKLPVVSARGFQDDCGDVAVPLHGLLDGVQVAGRYYHHTAPGLCGDPGRRAVRAGHGVVVPPVEVILQLDDLVAPGVRPRQAHRHQRGFGAAAVESHSFHGRHQVHYGPGPAQLLIGARAQVGSPADLFRNGIRDGRMGVPQEQRAVTGNVVDVLVPVHVPLPRPLSVSNVQREGFCVSVVVSDTSRKYAHGVTITFGGAGVIGDVLFQDGGHFLTPHLRFI